ncbi:MAG: sulfatase-like hydrolase/transferase [Deltaproteobacteria bacterium]|nr:sulfatase-like hydrolase/transferase [Deltaproteobacteria bacterium]
MLMLAWPLGVGGALTFFLESFILPRPRPCWKRPLAAISIHFGFWLLFFVLILALFRRPYLASTVVLALFLFLVLISNAKFNSLSEPFVFQDYEYFFDAFRHPRFYFPFFGVRLALSITAGIGLALFAGTLLESPLTAIIPVTTVIIGLMVLIALGLIFLWLGARQHLKMTFNPRVDIERFGLMPTVLSYALEERKPIGITPGRTSGVSSHHPRVLPNLLVVQSESFFDVRRAFPGIRPDVLGQFDLFKKASIGHGLLDVPAWGANTVRTEFAFFSGLDSTLLGVHRFNPYRWLVQQNIPTLTGFLKKLGYKIVCVHPYTASYYARDKIFPLLGFDEFIDIKHFNGAGKQQPYVGDLALAEKVGSIWGTYTRNSKQPLFLFVITMENHGPLHLESVQPDDMTRFLFKSLPKDCDDLIVYLRHLSNADQMIARLRRLLSTFTGDNWFCFYGDHTPIMPKVYERYGVPDGKTDYVIWNNKEVSGISMPLEMEIEELGSFLLNKMGLLTLDDEPANKLRLQSPYPISPSADSINVHR